MREAKIKGVFAVLWLLSGLMSSVISAQEPDGKILSSKPWPPLPKYDSLYEFGRGYFPESVREEAHLSRRMRFQRTVRGNTRASWE